MADHVTPSPSRTYRRRRGGGLTVRILGVNFIAPFVLLIGMLYMGEYRQGLIMAEIETLKAQSQLFSGAIAEAAIRPVESGKPLLLANPDEIESLVPELSRRMIRRLGETTNNRTILFGNEGLMMGDSHKIPGVGGVVHITNIDADQPNSFSHFLGVITSHLMEIMPNKTNLPPYPTTKSSYIDDYPDAERALHGYVSATAWKDKEGRLILTAAAPVQKSKHVLGVVMIARDGREIDYAMARVRLEVLTVFLGALSITIFVSLYLAGTIARPLRRLSLAAEDVRVDKAGHVALPDFSRRNDEIGDLSVSMRTMTQALLDRMNTIERFAADVAHEIKNPLTSLRSAVETIAIVKDKDNQKKLYEIIKHDIQRLDRLITDISQASRLDAELSRDEISFVDLRILLTHLATTHDQSHLADKTSKDKKSTKPHIRFIAPDEVKLTIKGNESRLAQVFENLITNAISFSPEGGIITIDGQRDKNSVIITIQDQGPGIPEGKLNAVFERFYTERPKHEAYGAHSGLGLSIAHQIITAHKGKIFAENMRDANDNIIGARFTVILDYEAS
jgi:two-component system sensor histidine kinase ChvG